MCSMVHVRVTWVILGGTGAGWPGTLYIELSPPTPSSPPCCLNPYYWDIAIDPPPVDLAQTVNHKVPFECHHLMSFLSSNGCWPSKVLSFGLWTWTQKVIQATNCCHPPLNYNREGEVGEWETGRVECLILPHVLFWCLHCTLIIQLPSRSELPMLQTTFAIAELFTQSLLMHIYIYIY